jgi:CMP-N-acetylneuraminic acid synthetase
MNIGLIIGKKTSTGVPGKNLRSILGRPSAEYAFIAAKYSGLGSVFVSTDCEGIAEIGSRYGAILIERPAELATPESLTEDVLLHAYERIKTEFTNISTISLFFCNNPAVDVNLLKESIAFLANDSQYDSVFSVVKYDMFSPVRARKLGEDSLILPFVQLDDFDNVSSIRNSSGSVYFCDLSIQVMKPQCIENIENGSLPFKWQGTRSKAVETDFGFDIDAEWQSIVIEHWLKKRGFTETKIPWELPS